MSSSPRPVTVISGGGRGIAAATALHLAGLGHAVALSYLEERAAVEQVAAASPSLCGRPTEIPQTDRPGDRAVWDRYGLIHRER